MEIQTLFGNKKEKMQLDSLDGIRAFCSLWILVLHLPGNMAFFSPSFQDILNIKDFIGQLGQGDAFGVEGMFFLSGFLLTLQCLIKSNDDDDDDQNVKKDFPGFKGFIEFYVRRFLFRIYPSLLLLPVLIISLGTYPASLLNASVFSLMQVFDPSFSRNGTMASGIEYFPWYLLHIQNMFPVAGPFGWLWTLAVQGQFYLLLPILMKLVKTKSNLLKLSVGMIAASVVFRYFYYFELNPVPAAYISFQDTTDLTSERWWNYFVASFAFYISTGTRLSTLFFGVILAIISTENGKFKKISLNPIYGFLLQAFFIPLILFCRYQLCFANVDAYPTFSETHKLIHMVFLETGGALESFSVFAFFFLLVHQFGPIGQMLDRFFAHRFWKPLARCSYQLYLCHPHILRGIMLHLLLNYIDTTSKISMIFCAIVCVLGCLMMAYIYAMVAEVLEKRIKQLFGVAQQKKKLH